MTDLTPTIVPKSDQLNADDLIGRTMTIAVTDVRLLGEADQPVAVHFEGDNGKPYKPCKSMRRVMVHIWGGDGKKYAGRRMTLYRDESVVFGGAKVGGIRISHMSDIDRDVTLALTATRASRKPYTVKPLRAAAEERRSFQGDSERPKDPPRQEPAGEELTLTQRADAYARRIADAPSTVKLKAIRAAGEKLRADLDQGDPERLVELEEAWSSRFVELEDAEKAGAQ